MNSITNFLQKFGFTIFFLSLFLGIAHTQIIKISDEVHLKNNFSYRILSPNQKQIILVIDRGNHVDILSFETNLKFRWKKELELSREKSYYIDAFTTNTSFCIAYRERIKNQTKIKINKYDLQGKFLERKLVKDLQTLFHLPSYNTIQSKDNTKIFITEQKSESEIYIMAYDIKLMKPIWDIYHKNKEAELIDLTASNDGNLFAIYEYANKKNRLSHHNLEILNFNEKGTSEPIIFKMNDRLNYNSKFEFDQVNNNLVAAGLYSIETNLWAEGYFYYKYNLKSQQHFIKYTEFPQNFVDKYMNYGNDATSRKKREKFKGINYTNIKNIVLRSDGGILILGEQNKILDRSYADTRFNYGINVGNSYIVDYYFDDIFIASINPNGTTDWLQALPKKQYSQDDHAAYSSFFLALTNTDLKLIFNDDIQTENTVSTYSLTPSGNSERQTIINTTQLNIRLRFSKAQQISSQTIIVPSETRNRLRLVSINL